jgi:hypothetical protein
MLSFASSDPADLAKEAANLCKVAINRHREDAHLGLKYLFERMTTGGLAMADVPELQQLGIAVFKNSGVAVAAKRVRQRHTASPLAVAIANVVEAAPPDQQQAVLLGAVLSAHAAVDIGQGDHALLVFAAISGAAVAQTTILTQPFIADGSGSVWAAKP